MHLTKVYPFCIIPSCKGQDFRERCRSFGGNSLPALPAGSTWRKADGRSPNALGDRYVQIPANIDRFEATLVKCIGI